METITSRAGTAIGRLFQPLGRSTHRVRRLLRDSKGRRLFAFVGAGAAVSIVLWLAGLLILLGFGWSAAGWNAFWGLVAVSFLGSIAIPLPGTTFTILISVASNPFALAAGVLGAATGGTLGATLLLGLGDTGRKMFKRRATSSKFRLRVLEWSERLAPMWTYLGVGLLLLPPFIPRVVVLAAASLVELKAVPYLVAVFVGTALRITIVAAGVGLLSP